MLGVVFDDIANSLVQEREQRVQNTSDGELHDMAVSLCLFQDFEDKVVSRQVRLEKIGRVRLHCQRLRGALAGRDGVFVEILKGHTSEGLEVIRYHHVRGYRVLAKPDHATSRNGGQGGIPEVLDLKHDTHVRRKVQALTVGQRE